MKVQPKSNESTLSNTTINRFNSISHAVKNKSSEPILLDVNSLKLITQKALAENSATTIISNHQINIDDSQGINKENDNSSSTSQIEEILKNYSGSLELLQESGKKIINIININNTYTIDNITVNNYHASSNMMANNSFMSSMAGATKPSSTFNFKKYKQNSNTCNMTIANNEMKHSQTPNQHLKQKSPPQGHNNLISSCENSNSQNSHNSKSSKALIFGSDGGNNTERINKAKSIKTSSVSTYLKQASTPTLTTKKIDFVNFSKQGSSSNSSRVTHTNK